MLSAIVVPLGTVYVGVAVGYLWGRSGLPDWLWARRPRLRAWFRRQPGAVVAAPIDHATTRPITHTTAATEPTESSALDALSTVLFFVLIPVLLFRAASRIDPATLPLGTLAAYFLPAVCAQLGLVQWLRRQQRRSQTPAYRHPPGAAAGPSPAPEWAPLWAFTATFGNTAQLGIPMATALFGDAGLALHLQIIALHALTLMTLATVQAELLRARASESPGARSGTDPGQLLREGLKVGLQTARRAFIHPVVLPIVAGLAFHAGGGQLPPWADAVLSTVASAAVPLCLVAIGWTLAEARGGMQALRDVLGRVGFKLLALPALVGAVASVVFGVHGQPLWVLVMAAALPAGANAVLFAQRYRVGQAETAAAVVASTVCFALTAPLWLALLGWLVPLTGGR